MLRKSALLVFAVFFDTVSAHEIRIDSGVRKGAIEPSLDYAVATYKHDAYRVGLFTSPTTQGLFTSYTKTEGTLLVELGQRERSLDQGFVVSNGAYLPWTRNFAFAEPIGARIGLQSKVFTGAVDYYQQGDTNLSAARAYLTPTPYFKISVGAAATIANRVSPVIPLAAFSVGTHERKGFMAGGEVAGLGNYLVHARYSGDALLRVLAFTRSDASALASGVYNASRGVVAQFMSNECFSQLFATDYRYALARYAGRYLTGVYVFEEKVQLMGMSLRTSPDAFHVRAGATLGNEGSLQTLAGIGYGDYIFLGGGSYNLYKDQPLEPIIFTSEWYSSVLLQSSSMRIKDTGYKMMALVNTKVVQGFVAITYAEDLRGREKFGFFARFAGKIVF